MIEPALEVDDIQGHVLVGFGGGYQTLLGLKFRVGAVAAGKAALLTCIDHVTPARASVVARGLRRRGMTQAGATPNPEVAGMAVAFSHSGLLAMGPFAGPDEVAFRDGAGAAARLLKDDLDDTGRAVGWTSGADTVSTPDVFVVLAATEPDVLEAAETSLMLQMDASFEIIDRNTGRRLSGEREHFGFLDGVSQPAPRGVINGVPLIDREYPPDHPLSNDYARPGQALAWPGQFVFGYATQQAESQEPGAESGAGQQLLRNGSILVFRRLRQDVAAFQTAMDQLARDFTQVGLPVSPQTAAAWCVGRWPDGTPISVSPEANDPEIAVDSRRRNGFLFRGRSDPVALVDGEGGQHAFPGAPGDRSGKNCPMFAHIRKVNPRDIVVDQGGTGISLKSQMLRRGIPYGDDWKGAEDGLDRGLLFMSYQTSIEHQFHRLMTLWVNSPAAPEGQGIDPLIGAPQGGRHLTRRPADMNNYEAVLPGRWVSATGAGYFFAPGIAGLRAILTQQTP